jgi:hypothetical protein
MLIHFLALLSTLSLTLALPSWPKYFPIPRPARPPRPAPISRRVCGTPNPPEYLREALSNLRSAEPDPSNDLWSPAAFHRRILSAPDHVKRANPLVTVNLYIHIVADSATAQPSNPGYITDAHITRQLNYLSAAYAPLSVSFTLQNTTRTTNDTWAANGDDLAMKRALRQGPYSALNLYFQSQLQSTRNDGLPPGQTLLGYCSLPYDDISATTPAGVYVDDGCNILSRTMPAEPAQQGAYNRGGTAAHETGHWFGLLHTFQDETCDATNYGDFVADTPQQSNATSGEEPRFLFPFPLNPLSSSLIFLPLYFPRPNQVPFLLLALHRALTLPKKRLSTPLHDHRQLSRLRRARRLVRSAEPVRPKPVRPVGIQWRRQHAQLHGLWRRYLLSGLDRGTGGEDRQWVCALAEGEIVGLLLSRTWGWGGGCGCRG